MSLSKKWTCKGTLRQVFIRVYRLEKANFLRTFSHVGIFKPALGPALQRQNTEISKQIFPEKEYRGLSPNFQIHVSVSDLYIPTIGLPILLEEICRPILGLNESLIDT
jgi:hypothetical protein